MTAKGYAISRSKTVYVPKGRLFKAWADPSQRAIWLPGHALQIRKALPESEMRITWSDEITSLNVYFYDKGLAKSSVSVKHVMLTNPEAVKSMRPFWSAALARLKVFVEQHPGG